MLSRALILVAGLWLLGWTTDVFAARLAADAVAEARLRGTARVLVLLDAPETANAASGNGPLAAAARALPLQDRVDRVLMSLPHQGYTVQRRYSQLPLVALSANAATLERLRTHPGVLRVDLDPRMRKSAAPDEALVLTKVADLQAAGLDGTGQKIAVIDSGVDTDHPDLASALLDQACFCSLVRSQNVGCCPNKRRTQTGAGAAEDADGHGSHVSGIILGRGIVAPRGGLPAARLVAVRVLDDEGSSCCASDVLAALDWLATTHPDVSVVNLSLGTDTLYPNHCDDVDSYTVGVKTAVARLAARGTVVVAAAGNDGNVTSMSAPACVSNTLSVGATWDSSYYQVTFSNCFDNNTTPLMMTCFSNRSDTTDVFAPGALTDSVGMGGGIETMAGTSQATPVVAACAGALAQAAPLSTAAQRMDAITLSPTRIGEPGSSRTFPFLDCRDAVRLLNANYFRARLMNGSQPLIPSNLPAPAAQNAPARMQRAPVGTRGRFQPRAER